MSAAPLVLGVNRTQDASVCLMRGSQLQWAIQKARLTRQKHHWGRTGDFANFYVPRLPGLEQAIDVLVECYSSDAEQDNLAAYERELAASLVLAPNCRPAHISHHLAHVYSVFHPSPFTNAAVMIVDGQGSPVSALTEHWSRAGSVPGNWCEVASFYRADRERIDCIDKQVWNRDDEQLVGLGMFYFLLTQAVFPGHGNEGKVMGLAPHGDAHALGLPPLHVEGGQVTIPRQWRETLRERGHFRYHGKGDPRFADIAALAAAGQRAFEDALIHGHSEFGPRALGHRSILGDPRQAPMRDWINDKVKLRESFRPLAPVVLLEYADRYFNISKESPFMQHAAPVRPDAAALVPAITHVDCTARLQTVGPDDDPFLRTLLHAFHDRTGVPVLLNTFFNGKDEPIVETAAEALETFRNTPMHALVMPPYVLRKRLEPEAAA